MTERLPTFLVIGAMRSGTSTLARWLGDHPDIFMAPGKELHFFDRHYDKGLDWYRSLFAGATTQSQIGEATPNYLHDPLAISRIAETLPEARLIMSLRNPVDRAHSHYWHNRARGKEPLSFEEALAAESSRIEGDDIDRAWFSYASRGDYMDQIEVVLRFFPREAVHIEVAEEMQADPTAVLPRIYRFLGVDDQFLPNTVHRKVNAYVEFRWVALRSLTKHLPRALAKPLNRINAKTGEEYPPMQAATRKMLEERYREGNRRLARFLGRADLWPGSEDPARKVV